MVTDYLELSAQIGYLDIADESERAFSASAYYYITNNVAIGQLTKCGMALTSCILTYVTHFIVYSIEQVSRQNRL